METLEILCEEFEKGAKEKGNNVKLIRLSNKKIVINKYHYIMKNNGICIQNDDMKKLLQEFKKADILVLATPIYFYGISSQMKTFIDRTYPIWQHLGKKEVYYIISAGLDEKIMRCLWERFRWICRTF